METLGEEFKEVLFKKKKKKDILHSLGKMPSQMIKKRRRMVRSKICLIIMNMVKISKNTKIKSNPPVPPLASP